MMPPRLAEDRLVPVWVAVAWWKVTSTLVKRGQGLPTETHKLVDRLGFSNFHPAGCGLVGHKSVDAGIEQLGLIFDGMNGPHGAINCLIKSSGAGVNSVGVALSALGGAR
jgi:hypothetical protein